ncbi:MAG: DUF305 domain-containing protein [Thermomicrobiaceae bacterium]|nr:DUF305 domain-containing protein [Thermomicrobiaceae bacterium]
MLDDGSFLAMMIQHHEGAIAMARIAERRAEHAEIKQLAQEIIASQQREIDQMRAWQEAWFGGATPVPSPETLGMSPHEMGMDMDMHALETAQPFDKAFIDAMVPHHQGAIMMAQRILQTTQRPELKQLAEGIVAAQQAEIAKMQEWRRAWYGQ